MSKTQHTADPFEQEVRYVKGVGPKRAAVLARLGIKTVRDLLLHLPRDHEDRRHPRPIAGLRVGEKAVVSGTIQSVEFRPTRGRMKGILDVAVTDQTGSLSLTWFNANVGWKKSFPLGEAITAYGALSFYSGLQMVAPDYQVGAAEPEKFGRILPVYPLTEGISQGVLCKLMLAGLQLAGTDVPEIFPRAFCREKGFPSITQALHDVHFPRSMQDMEAARRRLCYEELFVFQTALALRRASLQRTQGIAFRVGPNVDRRIRRLFPFSFTSAQDRVIKEVAADMRSPRPMNRLLQGDVGSGKTVVAVYAMLAALAESSQGYQAALMAPTEILAEQHFLTLGSLLEKARIRTAL
ncbi:MAG: DEAD/DEAH box helicase, partial [Planctomycetota bacterium]